MKKLEIAGTREASAASSCMKSYVPAVPAAQTGVLRALVEARLAAQGGLSEGIVRAATHAYKTLSAAAKAQFALLGEAEADGRLRAVSSTGCLLGRSMGQAFQEGV